jgi:hypothetical protein
MKYDHDDIKTQMWRLQTALHASLLDNSIVREYRKNISINDAEKIDHDFRTIQAGETSRQDILGLHQTKG